MTYVHEPVLLNEVIHYLDPKPGQHFIDCTLGGGGHTAALCRRTAPNGSVLSIDLDPLALTAAQSRLGRLADHVTFVQGNFKNIRAIAEAHQFSAVDGILLDLGLSSGQLQDQPRGFSFLAEGTLDMRFDPDQPLTAREILSGWPAEKLAALFRDFGEEPLATPIAKAIVEQRTQAAIETPTQLLSIISPLYRRRYRKPSRINPATKVFQALRIAVNDELENLRRCLPQAVALLAPGGRLGVISYHSLEDRIVKNFFRQESQDCICPPERPECQCGHHRTVTLINKKPTIPTADEILKNPRSRSAKLRVVEKI